MFYDFRSWWRKIRRSMLYQVVHPVSSARSLPSVSQQTFSVNSNWIYRRIQATQYSVDVPRSWSEPDDCSLVRTLCNMNSRLDRSFIQVPRKQHLRGKMCDRIVYIASNSSIKAERRVEHSKHRNSVFSRQARAKKRRSHGLQTHLPYPESIGSHSTFT